MKGSHRDFGGKIEKNRQEWALGTRDPDNLWNERRKSGEGRGAVPRFPCVIHAERDRDVSTMSLS
jgi:hypothetical protein